MMLQDGSAIKKLAQSNLSTKEKIIAKINDLLNMIAKVFESVIGTSNEYAELREAKANFEELQRRWNAALADATETFNGAQGAQNADSVIQYSMRDEQRFNPDGKTLDQLLHDIRYSAQSFERRYLYFGRFTSEFRNMLHDAGIEVHDLPIAMNYRDAYLSMVSKEEGRYKGENINYHNLGENGLKSAIASISSPDAIIRSKRDGRIELALGFVDYKGQQGLAVVVLNSIAVNAQRHIDAHIVASIYGKRNIDNFIAKADADGRLIYSKKEDSAQGISPVQYRGNINAKSSDTIVPQSEHGVNMDSMKKTEKYSLLNCNIK